MVETPWVMRRGVNMRVCAWERGRKRQIVTDRQTKQGDTQTARQSWQDWGNRCVYVFVSYDLLWPTKQYRFATAVLVPLGAFSQEERAVLQRHTARPHGSPRLYTTYTDSHHTCTITIVHLKISQIHTFVRSAHLWNHTHSNRHVSLSCTLLIDSIWQILPAGTQVRSRGRETYRCGGSQPAYI